jgi:hypothetical protein
MLQKAQPLRHNANSPETVAEQTQVFGFFIFASTRRHIDVAGN